MGGETDVDWQEDIVEMPELETDAYDFVQFYREGSDMHERGGFDMAALMESIALAAFTGFITTMNFDLLSKHEPPPQRAF